MILGIDLGTTYSAAAYIDKNGEVQVITNAEGKRITPSVFFEESAGNIIIGEIAKENALIRPNDVVSVVKNHMGSKDTFTTSSGKVYSPEEISSFIIRKMVKDAEAYSGEKVTDVIITVPAYFNDSQRKATEDAARIAGVNMLGSINEPTAAMLGYVKKKNLNQGIFMIYDLGGGTFDVSIVRVEGEEIRVIGTGGLANAGGHFFDMEIVKYVCNVLLEKHNLDLELPEYMEDYQELLNKAENAKIQLSSRASTSIIMKVGSVRENIEITRDYFESKLKKVYRNTETKMKSAMRDANVTKEEIDAVLLVGGSSRIPFFEHSVQAFMGLEPAKDINPDEAVAVGAALFGNLKQKNEGKKVFYDTNSHSIGFIHATKDRRRINSILIHKNRELPAKETMNNLGTTVPNQERFVIPITEGEAVDVEGVDIIDEIDIKLPPALEKGTQVIITFELDEYQMLHVYISIPSVPNWDYEYRLNRKANLSDEEISTMIGIVQDYAVS